MKPGRHDLPGLIAIAIMLSVLAVGYLFDVPLP